MIKENFTHNVEVSGGEGTVVVQENHGTINYQAPYIDTQTKEDLQYKRSLLAVVKQRWITGFLESSLPPQGMIELIREKRTDAVKQSFHSPEESQQILPPGMSEFEVFDQVGAGQTLLILGEPGAGKTITLLKLAKDLIVRAEEDPSLLIPVVFNLSSWRSKDKNQDIAEWLIQELTDRYGVSKDLGKSWIKRKQLILLLDGLDEVKGDRREACVQAINEFIEKYGPTKVVVCSHFKEYTDLSVKLEFEGAILIRSLTSEQIDQYLHRAGEPLGAIKVLLNQNPELQELAKSPLMLSILIRVYQGKKVEDLPQAVSLGDLFDRYIEQLFSQEIMGKPGEYKAPYPEPQTRRWLAWLAQKMDRTRQKEFFIEQMQPTWLESKAQKRGYRINNMLFGGAIFGLFFGFLALLSSWWTFAPNLKWAIINGQIAFLFFGLILGWGKAEIKTVETIKWSWKTAANSLLLGGIIGVSAWLLLSFALLLWYGSNSSGYFAEESEYIRYFGFIGGFIAGLSYVLVNALKGPAVQKKLNPNQGIWVSLKNAMIIVCTISIPLILGIWLRSDMPNLGLRVGLRWALLFGIGFGGGVPCIRHFTLRRILCRNNNIPWNYADFLDYATQRGFMQKVGGGYIFTHSMLQKHFAQLQ